MPLIHQAHKELGLVMEDRSGLTICFVNVTLKRCSSSDGIPGRATCLQTHRHAKEGAVGGPPAWLSAAPDGTGGK